jgi:hypothetical protein
LSTSKIICNALKKGDTQLVKKYLEKIRKKDSHHLEITENYTNTNWFDYSYDDVLDIYPYKAKRIVVRENGMIVDGEHGDFLNHDPIRIYEAQKPKVEKIIENRAMKKLEKEKIMNNLETLNKTNMFRSFLNPVSSSRTRSRSSKRSRSSYSSSSSSRRRSRSSRSRNINEQDIEAIREYLRTLKYREKKERVFTENDINKVIVELNKNPHFVRSKDKVETIKIYVEKAYNDVDDDDVKDQIEIEMDRIASGDYDFNLT